MISIINEMDNKTGNIETKTTYSCNTKTALIAYIRQLKKDFNTFDYPDYIEGIVESKIVKGTYYFADVSRDVIIQSFEGLN